jgi:hypothetical protein
MRIDRQRLGLFFNLVSLWVRPANPHRHLHQHPLAAASRPRIRRSIRCLSHPNLTGSTIPPDIPLSSLALHPVSQHANGTYWVSKIM